MSQTSSNVLIGFTPEAIRQHERVVRKVNSIRGAGACKVYNNPDNIVIHVDYPPTPPAPRHKPDEVLLVKLTGTLTGGGQYEGVLLQAIAYDVTGNATAAKLGTDGETAVVVVNLRELGAATHDLDYTRADNVFKARRWGMTDEATPRQVLVVDGLQADNCEAT